MFIRIIAILLALTPGVFADIIIEEGQIKRIRVTKWKGNWAAPGGKHLEHISIVVTQWKQGEKHENDAKIIEAINSGDEFEVKLANYPISYSAPNHDYKWLKKHRIIFSGKVRPKLSVVGTLRVGAESEYNSKHAIYLYEPTLSSRRGSMFLPRVGSGKISTERAGAQANFQTIYDGE